MLLLTLQEPEIGFSVTLFKLLLLLAQLDGPKPKRPKLGFMVLRVTHDAMSVVTLSLDAASV
jgi:hypothetical protein